MSFKIAHILKFWKNKKKKKKNKLEKIETLARKDEGWKKKKKCEDLTVKVVVNKGNVEMNLDIRLPFT